MRLIKYCLVAILAVLVSNFAKADGGYNIKVHIDGLADSTVYLGYYFGDNLFCACTGQYHLRVYD